MRTGHTALLISAAAVAAALSSCTIPPPAPLRSGSGPTGPSIPLTADLFPQSRADTKAPEEVRSKTYRLSCGEIVLQHGQTVPQPQRTCLETQIGHQASELVIAQTTTEGDPTISYYLTSPGLNGFDLITDSTRDRYSDGRWTRQRCAPARAIDNPTNCSER